MYAYVQQGTNVKVNSLFYNGKERNILQDCI